MTIAIAKAICDGLFVFCLLMGFFVLDEKKTPRLRVVNWALCIAALATGIAFHSLGK